MCFQAEPCGTRKAEQIPVCVIITATTTPDTGNVYCVFLAGSHCGNVTHLETEIRFNNFDGRLILNRVVEVGKCSMCLLYAEEINITDCDSA